MTERERFIKALKRQPVEGHCPTFELVFYLTLEALGRIHPSHLRYDQWKQMSPAEQRLQIEYQADTYIGTAEKYRHSAIFVHPNPGDFENTVRLLETIREKTGDKYYLTMHGDCTFSIPDGNSMMAFSERMYEDEDGLKADAQRMLENSVRFAEKLAKRPGLLDGFTLCSDYCFNVNPFFSNSSRRTLKGSSRRITTWAFTRSSTRTATSCPSLTRWSSADRTRSIPSILRAGWIWRRPSGCTAIK